MIKIHMLSIVEGHRHTWPTFVLSSSSDQGATVVVVSECAMITEYGMSHEQNLMPLRFSGWQARCLADIVPLYNVDPHLEIIRIIRTPTDNTISDIT